MNGNEHRMFHDTGIYIRYVAYLVREFVSSINANIKKLFKKWKNQPKFLQEFLRRKTKK
jgi:hypothetical protein